MELKEKIGITAAFAGVLLIASVAGGIQNRRRDHKASLFFSELERNIAPATAGLEDSDAFDIRYWKDLSAKIKKPYYMLKAAAADSYAKDINDAFGWIFNNKDKIYGVFRAMKDKVQVSQMSNAYYIKYKINLIDDLRSHISDEMGQVMKIVGKLPDYRVPESSKPIKP
jgi:hypothetical protein